MHVFIFVLFLSLPVSFFRSFVLLFAVARSFCRFFVSTHNSQQSTFIRHPHNRQTHKQTYKHTDIQTCQPAQQMSLLAAHTHTQKIYPWYAHTRADKIQSQQLNNLTPASTQTPDTTRPVVGARWWRRVACLSPVYRAA